MISPTRFDPVTAKLVNAYPASQTSALVNNYISNIKPKRDIVADDGQCERVQRFVPVR